MARADILTALCCLAAASASAGPAEADQPAETVSIHAQVTAVLQDHPSFHSDYRGANSLDPGSRGNETIDVTVFFGFRPWRGGALYINPEIDQGFGLSNTLGVAGFPSGEAYKVGKSTPYFRLQRLFARQTFNLGGEGVAVEPQANQLGETRSTNTLILTAGKFSVTDIFDTNAYAHDPKADLLNWALIDAGAFDYAADAWGYSYGLTAEWAQDWWTLRAGGFALSRVPNSTRLDGSFSQFELVGEGEARETILGQPGKIKVLAFLNRGRMASYADAVAAAKLNAAPDVANVRRYSSRPGLSLNLEQRLTDTLGLFARASINDGHKEADEFTEINRSISAGLSLKGAGWSRPDDILAIGAVINKLSMSAKRYLAAGGLGILIGDGRLDRYGSEDIVELSYSYALSKTVAASFDYQLVVDPAYNRDRGPVSFLALRLHIGV